MKTLSHHNNTAHHVPFKSPSKVKNKNPAAPVSPPPIKMAPHKESSIKELNFDELEKPKTILIVYYKDRRLSIPVFGSCYNAVTFVKQNLIRFEEEVIQPRVTTMIQSSPISQSRKNQHSHEKSKYDNHNKTITTSHFGVIAQQHPKLSVRKLKGSDGRQLISFRTKERDILKDYFIVSGRDVSQLHGFIELEPIYKPISPSPRGGFAHYQIFRCIGQGAYSKVYLAQKLSDGNFYALKVIDKRLIGYDNRIQVVRNTEHLMRKLNHPFLIHLHTSFETPRYVVLVLDYCPGGELYNYMQKVKTLSEEEAKIYITQILLALEYLHKQRIIYRDLKLQNVLLDADGHIKLIDFSLAKQGLGQHQKSFSFCGSHVYMAPEMVQQSGHSYSVDFYSVGAIMYEFVYGVPPFYNEDRQKMLENIVNEELKIPGQVADVSAQYIDLLKKLLAKSPAHRIGTIGGAKEVLSHPWFKKTNLKHLLERVTEASIVPNLLEFNFDDKEIEIDLEEMQLMKTEVEISREVLRDEDSDHEQTMKPLNGGGIKGKSPLQKKKKKKKTTKESPKSNKKIPHNSTITEPIKHVKDATRGLKSPKKSLPKNSTINHKNYTVNTFFRQPSPSLQKERKRHNIKKPLNSSGSLLQNKTLIDMQHELSNCFSLSNIGLAAHEKQGNRGKKSPEGGRGKSCPRKREGTVESNELKRVKSEDKFYKSVKVRLFS